MNKQVKNQVGKQVKKIFLLNLLNAIKEGKNPTQIAKDLNVSKQKIAYYVRKLKDKGLIKQVGYGTWETSKNSTKVALDKEVRGHAFMWKVRLPEIRNWRKRQQILDKLKIPYKLVGALKQTPRIMIKDRKVWLGDKHLIIYEPENFTANTALEAKKLAVWRLKSVLEALEKRLKVNFKINKNYEFKVARQHYALMKNMLAIQYNENNEKLNIYTKDGLWFVIDNSYNFEEAETLHPKTALDDNKKVQDFFNGLKEFEDYTPQFVVNAISQNATNQAVFSENMMNHLRILTKLGIAVDNLTKAVLRKNIKQNLNENQRSLNDY